MILLISRKSSFGLMRSDRNLKLNWASERWAPAFIVVGDNIAQINVSFFCDIFLPENYRCNFFLFSKSIETIFTFFWRVSFLFLFSFFSSNWNLLQNFWTDFFQFQNSLLYFVELIFYFISEIYYLNNFWKFCDFTSNLFLIPSNYLIFLYIFFLKLKIFKINISIVLKFSFNKFTLILFSIYIVSSNKEKQRKK